MAPSPQVRKRSRPCSRFLRTLVAGVVLITAGCSTFEPVVTEALISTVPDTTELPGLTLTAYEPAEAFLNHPTVLPNGWELCRHLEEVGTGDRFCAPDDPDTWLQVAVTNVSRVRLDEGDPIDGSERGVWLSTGERSDAAFATGPNDVIVVSSRALADEELVAVAESIPVVQGRDFLEAAVEPTIDLDAVTDEDLAGLLGSLDEAVRITRRDRQVSVFTSVVILRLFPIDQPYVPDLALWIPKPRQVDADRPLVVGRSERQRRSYAIWDQLGYGWRLEGQMTVDEVSALARNIIELAAELPGA